MTSSNTETAPAPPQPVAAAKQPHKAAKKRSRAKSKRTNKSAQAANAVRSGSKKARILALLRRPSGASLAQLQKATGWQAHSVRGFLSGSIKKQMGLLVQSNKLADGTRAYRISSK